LVAGFRGSPSRLSVGRVTAHADAGPPASEPLGDLCGYRAERVAARARLLWSSAARGCAVAAGDEATGDTLLWPAAPQAGGEPAQPVRVAGASDDPVLDVAGRYVGGRWTLATCSGRALRVHQLSTDQAAMVFRSLPDTDS
jgi:hypothetical protein